MVVGTDKSKICRAGQPTGNSHKSSCGSLESEIHREASWKLRQGRFLCCSLEAGILLKPQPLLVKASVN